jgi:hypothetical protein
MEKKLRKENLINEKKREKRVLAKQLKLVQTRGI